MGFGGDSGWEGIHKESSKDSPKRFWGRHTGWSAELRCEPVTTWELVERREPELTWESMVQCEEGYRRM
jgi:hypothetical protein